MGCPRDFAGRLHCKAHDGHRRGIFEVRDNDGFLGLGPWQNFEDDRGQCRQRAKGIRHQLRQVITGDILYHARPGLEDFPASRNAAHAKYMVAGRAALDAPWTAKIAGQQPAQRTAVGTAEKLREIRRFKGQLLASRANQFFDLGQPRTGPRLEDQFFGFIGVNGSEARKLQRPRTLHQSSPSTLGTCADNLERCRGTCNMIGQFRFGGGLQHIGHQNLGMSGNGNCPAFTCMRPSSAQRCSVGNTLPGLSRP